MKALLIAGGRGTRLKPLTDNLPKVLIPIAGKPCIQYTIENLRSQGVHDFLVTVGYMAERVMDYLKDGRDLGVRVRYFQEPQPMGTAGALPFCREFLNETFAVVYADNFANYSLESLLKVHRAAKAQGTIAVDTFRSQKNRGVVVSSNNQVLRFVEKPDQEIPNGAINSGFYVLEPKVIEGISQTPCDFGRDILPTLARSRSLYCAPHRGYIFDIGIPQDLEQAESYARTVLHLNPLT